MHRTLAALIVLTFAAPLFAQATATDLERRLKEVEKERDGLRRELALAKLKITTLEGKLASLGGKADPKAGPKTGGTTATGTSTKEGGDDDTDDAGVAKATNIWDVKMVSSKQLDAGQVDGEIGRLSSEAATARQEIAAGKKRLDTMRLDNEKYDREYERDKARGFARGTKRKPYLEDALGEARLAIQKAETKERVASRRVLGLEREKAEAGKTLIVTCASVKDGTVMQLYCKGPVRVFAEAMVEGRKYVIEGRKGGADTIVVTKISGGAE